jgi:hypothetical protein
MMFFVFHHTDTQLTVVVIYFHFKNLLWAKLRDYAISRANPILILMFLVRVVVFWYRSPVKPFNGILIKF